MAITNKKIHFVVLVIIVLILITFILNATKREYGNDEESILKVIRSIDGYNFQSIKILEMGCSIFNEYLQGEELPNLKFLFVTNEDNEIAKVELDVNGQVFKKEFKVHEILVAWIDLPKHKSAEYKYKYYNENGKLKLIILPRMIICGVGEENIHSLFTSFSSLHNINYRKLTKKHYLCFITKVYY